MNSNIEHPFRLNEGMPSRPSASVDGVVTLSALSAAVLRGRRTVVWLAMVAALLAGGVTLLSSPNFASSVAFLPQSTKASQGFAGIATQFGLTLPSSDGFQSPQFYADLIQSRPVLAATVDAVYADPEAGGRSRSLVDILTSRKRGPAPLRRETAIDLLRSAVSVSVSLKTGVISYEVATHSPLLSQQIAARILQLLNEFNRVNKQSQAGAERRFTEARLADVSANLRAQEDQLQRFLQSNRDLSNSPALRLQQERLAREVGTERELYNRLTLAFEQARIEEVRDTPVITVVQPPETPVRPRSRGLPTRLLLALALGGMLGLLISVIPAFFKGSMTEPSRDSEELALLTRETVHDLKRPWRLFWSPARS